MMSTSLPPLRIGILGAAKIARGFVAGVAGSRKVKVASIASRDIERCRAFARETGVPQVHDSYEALLADPAIDAIYNPLPNTLHAQWSIRAAEAGKHVLCEKPLAVSAAEARAMFAAAERHRVHLVEAFPYRAQPQTQKVQELIANRAIGTVQFVRASFGIAVNDAANIRLDPLLSGGALMDTGSYTVNFVRMIVGERPSRVSAVARWGASGVDLTMVANLEHPGGVLAQISCSFATALHRQATVAGDGGIIDTTFANHTATIAQSSLQVKIGAARDAPTITIETSPVDGFLAEAESFADLIAHGPAHWTGTSHAESIDNMTTLEAIAASARQARAVSIEPAA